ncbi:MAG: hypothetical protein RQM90_08670 [Methanoculleus sp.]
MTHEYGPPSRPIEDLLTTIRDWLMREYRAGVPACPPTIAPEDKETPTDTRMEQGYRPPGIGDRPGEAGDPSPR